MSLTDEQLLKLWAPEPSRPVMGRNKILEFARAIESAATAPLLERIAGLEANEKVLLAQVQGHTEWRERIIKASERSYGESAIRYKFSLTKPGKCMNTFPREIDGRWFALVPAEDDGHIGHIARIAELERELEALRKDAGRYRWLRKQNETLENNSWTITTIDFTDSEGPRRWWVGSDLDAAIDAAKEQG